MKLKDLPFFLMWAVVPLFMCALYFVAFAGPLMILVACRSFHPLVLLAMAIVGWHLAAIIFCFLIVLLRRILAPEIRPGRFILTNDALVSGKKLRPWFLGNLLHSIVIRGPFWQFVSGWPFTCYLYYRGMGAQIDPTFYAMAAFISEPWAVRVGKNAVIGGEAIITAHKREKSVITHQPVDIGDNVVLGARCILMPGVKIGDGATVGANAVVLAGTQIPPGEIWAGNPARKIELVR